jgi:MFS family permease
MEQFQKRPGWRDAIQGNVLAMGLVSMFTDASSEMIYPLLPVFFTGLVPLGMAAVYVGLMEGVAETTASLLKIFSGGLSDKLGKRKSLVVAGYGLSTFARPLMALAFAGWNVVALRFLDRIGKGIRTSPRDALIGDSVDKSVRGLAFSFHRSMDHLGAVLGPLTAMGVLYLFLGKVLWQGNEARAGAEEMNAMRWLFVLSLIPGIFAMMALVGKVKEIAPKPSPAATAAKKGGVAGRLPKSFYAFVGIVTLFALGNSSDLFLLLLGKERFGLGLFQVILMWILLHVSKIAFSLPGGAMSDRFGRRPLIVAGWIVYALVYMGMAEVQVEWQFWAIFIAYGAFYGLTEGAEKALVADFVPSEYRGTAFGIYHGAVGIAALPASLIFGLFWEALGPRTAFGIGAGLAGLSAVLLLILLSTSRRKVQAE